MTPIANALPGSPEYRYTEAHIQARNCVERTNGVLKGRFQCLGKILRYSPEKVGYIANACAILHNMFVAARLNDDFDIPPHEEADDYDHHNVVYDPRANREGNIVRRNIIQRYFSN